MENLTSEQFLFLAFKGFSVGFGLGMLLWGFSYFARLLRSSVKSACRMVDV